jgi:hypothetical protein
LIDIDIPGVDFDASGSSMLVLNAMKKDEGFCGFFAKYMDKLVFRTGIPSLYGRIWSCPIPASGGRRRTRRRHRRRIP